MFKSSTGFRYLVNDVYGWGRNLTWQLGTRNFNENLLVPTGMGKQRWSKVACGATHTLAIREDGTLWGCGNNTNYQLGTGNNTTLTFFAQLGVDTNWESIGCGYQHSVAIKKDGTLWSWGANVQNQLGFGPSDTTTRQVPTQVGSAIDWSGSVLRTNNYHSVIVKADGTLWVMGYNGSGQLGNGTGPSGTNSAPTRVGVLNNWVTCGCGPSTSFAINSIGELWAVGENVLGWLGIGNTLPTWVTTLTKIGVDTDWKTVSSGQGRAHAIKTNGTLWFWGNAGTGQRGNGTTTPDVISPVQVGIDTDWKDVSCTYTAVAAIKNNGTLWTWGNSFYGTSGLGAGNTIVTTPTKMGTLTRWNTLAQQGSAYHMIATVL